MNLSSFIICIMWIVVGLVLGSMVLEQTNINFSFIQQTINILKVIALIGVISFNIWLFYKLIFGNGKTFNGLYAMLKNWYTKKKKEHKQNDFSQIS